jgi:hypothetical protein
MQARSIFLTGVFDNCLMSLSFPTSINSPSIFNSSKYRRVAFNESKVITIMCDPEVSKCMCSAIDTFDGSKELIAVALTVGFASNFNVMADANKSEHAMSLVAWTIKTVTFLFILAGSSFDVYCL